MSPMRVHDELRAGGPLTAAELCSRLQCPVEDAYAALVRLDADGLAGFETCERRSGRPLQGGRPWYALVPRAQERTKGRGL